MKCKIESENVSIEIEERGETLEELLVVIDQAIRGLGYYPKGNLVYIEDF